MLRCVILQPAYFAASKVNHVLNCRSLGQGVQFDKKRSSQLLNEVQGSSSRVRPDSLRLKREADDYGLTIHASIVQ